MKFHKFKGITDPTVDWEYHMKSTKENQKEFSHTNFLNLKLKQALHLMCDPNLHKEG